MKKVFILCVVALALFSFKADFYELNKKTAEVNKVDGLLIFMESEPVQKFEVLGTVKKTVTMTGNYFEIRKGLIKKAKSEYKTADGIIMYLGESDLSTSKADVIKFKE